MSSLSQDGSASRGAGSAGGRTPFQRYHDGLVHTWSGTVAGLAMVLVPAFLVLDAFSMPPELLERFALYRAAVTGISLVLFFVIRRTKPGPFSFLYGYAVTLTVGGAIVWMTVDLGGFDSSYYAGLNLVIAANLLLPWNQTHAALNAFALLLMYVGTNALFGGAFLVESVLNNLFFLGGTTVIAVATSTVKFRLIVNEFDARAELMESNQSLERSQHELKAARDALWGEMEVAKRIQTALLPANQRVGPYDVAARMLPAAEVGGDYYDIIDGNAGTAWICIGDVSGHGVESGLVMMMTQTSILSLVQENPRRTPAEVFTSVNGVLNENMSRLATGRYMTLNVVQLGERGLTLAGKHQDILVWRRTAGRVENVTNEGCWIGIAEDLRGQIANLAVPMAEGDVALFYTDGATEAMNASGEMFGETRLSQAFGRVADRPLEQALEALFREVAAFQAQQDDDITMMLVRRLPAA
ncbi:MAG TPA: PP2C family protein-serine/threonine phosphatase [Anaeromyxobacteraceae bacterium]|nr:PP2C family protein-serine/threonine phosphatase [Anaeromyxobacteraceae bacterium]